ncbi:MAG: hypothetical protein H7070_12020 [Saprospiraceae bacterium]|nr:hypothetical protein [Pyrinomonadaceae bacterium]
MQSNFADVLEAVDELPIDEKEMLVDILQHRMIEDRREALRVEIENSRREFAEGLCKPSTPEEILREVLS